MTGSQNWHPDFVWHRYGPGKYVKVVPVTFRGQARAFELRSTYKAWIIPSGAHDFMIWHRNFEGFERDFLAPLYAMVQGRDVGPEAYERTRLFGPPVRGPVNAS